MLPLIEDLFKALEAERVLYCHWKSNIGLGRSAEGEDDLDLLVGRSDAGRFAEVVFRLGFREARAEGGRRLPGVLDYYGYDHRSVCLIHIHTHYQLVLGSDLSKNYRLPLELPYLTSSSAKGLIRIPAPEYELVVLVIRLVLKHSTWDAWIMGQDLCSSSEKRELVALALPETLCNVDSVLAHLPVVDKNLFEACLDILPDGKPLIKRIKVARQLQKALRSYTRTPQMTDSLLKFYRRVWYPIKSRIFKMESKRRPANGGLLISFVGGDGSGKTTAIDEIFAWLSGSFKTIKVHMGKPTWSLTTILVRGFLKIGTMLHLYPFNSGIDEPYSTAFPGYPSLIRSVCTARDRYLTYRRARRFSSNGGLVLSDRYPLPGIIRMDGEQCEWTTRDRKPNGFLRLLSRLEKSFYRMISLPDLLIVLRVDPEIAVARKTDETEVSVRARSNEIWKLDWAETPAHVIDAARPKEEIIAQLKALIWSHL
jgi:thymidylate kinase